MQTLKTLATAAVLVIVAPFAATAYAQSTMDHSKMDGKHMAGMKMENMAAGQMTDGEVRKIDKDSQKITLKHGDIKSLDMPAMTMVFKARDASMLDKLQVGSKIRFMAEKIDGALVVTMIESVK